MQSCKDKEHTVESCSSMLLRNSDIPYFTHIYKVLCSCKIVNMVFLKGSVLSPTLYSIICKELVYIVHKNTKCNYICLRAYCYVIFYS